MPLYRQTGDLLESEADWIVQQCNCLTVRAHGLSRDIAAKFPDSNPYVTRRAVDNRNLAQEADRSVPGTIEVMGRVVCLMAQWRPGNLCSPYFLRYPESDPPETAAQREVWFKACLANLNGISGRVAFPDHIGCGLAGGNWEHYEQMIEHFAERNDVVIIKWEPFW